MVDLTLKVMMQTTRRTSLAPWVLLLALGLSFGSSFRAAELHAQVFLDNLDDDEIYGQNESDRSDQPDGENLGQPEELLRPDAKENGDAGLPPQSAEESKQNKLDLDLGDATLDKPLERPKLLAHLYEQLSATNDAAEAQPIMEAIEDLWVNAGSDTAALLLARAERFLAEADVDLAIKILDALVEIAPENAEAWHQRARAHLLKQDYGQALGDLRRALNIDPKHYRAINNLGLVLEGLGAKKEALDAYRKALKVNPFLEETRRAVESLAREVEGQDI